jgi:hypothetical protein
MTTTGTTIDELARTIANTHGIDTFAAARDVVAVHVDQIADDPDLWDAEACTLTPSGAELVAGVVAESYAIGANATDAQLLLNQIEDAAAAISQAERVVADKTAERDNLIRAALGTELRRADIAAAAGVKEARLYQIRDGRR